jgi:hypothetical protein
MDSSRAAAPRPHWWSLWATALASLIAQLGLCQFFTFGRRVPLSIDVDPSNLWKYAYHFPPRGEFLTLNWLGIANLPPTLNPFSLAAAHFSTWFFFTAYAPMVGTLALLAMAAFLREMELPRPAALFGGVIYAWQGDLLPFVFPGHYGYITTWPFFAVAAWGALRAQRMRHWVYAIVSGASCGMMVGLQPDRGAIASLVIAALYFAPALGRRARSVPSHPDHRIYSDKESFKVRLFSIAAFNLGFLVRWFFNLRHLILCAGLALLISLAAFLALFQSYIVGVKLGGSADREQTFNVATQFSLGPAETLTYLVPGFFGWTSSSIDGPYWGWIGQTPDWPKTHEGTRNLNLAVSTTGTIASLLALLGACLLLPGAPGRFFGHAVLNERQIYFARLFALLGGLALILSWGYHTPLYRPLFGLPLMDKWRDPLKWLEGANFAMIVLAALGAEVLLRSLAPDARPLRRTLQIFFGVATGLLAVGCLAGYPLSIAVAANLNQTGYEPPLIANAMHTLHLSLGFALGLAVAAWMVLLGAWQAERLRQWEIVNPWLRGLWNRMLAPDHLPVTLAAALAALGALQLGWVASEFIEPTDLARITATNSLLEALKAEGPAVRVAVPVPQDPFLNFYLQNQFVADRISSVDISAASRIPDALAAFFDAFDKHPARLWFLTGVKNVALAQQSVAPLHQDPEVAAAIEKADGYTLAEAGTGDEPSHALVGLRDYLAKATFVPGAEVIPQGDEQLQRLVDPKWNPRETILLSTPPPAAAAGMDSAKNGGPAQVELSTYTPHEIRIDVDAPSSGYVLINDQYDPDWQVEVNGRPAKLLKADYLLRAVAVGPGTSKIVLRYVAHYRVAGIRLPVVATNLFCDGTMIAAWLVAGFVLWRPRRR